MIDIHSSIHAWHNRKCYDATGFSGPIADLRKAADLQGTKVKNGKCADATDCSHWRNLKVCRSAPNDEDVYILHKGKCIMLHGEVNSNHNGEVDSAFE